MIKRKLLVLLLLLLSACSASEDNSNGLESGAAIFPLTGIETNENADNRIVAVMINNSPEARPQTGLSQADIVFEMLTEGNVTRLLALYQSEYPEVVGPVRSAREYYLRLAQNYNAIFVYHGAASFVDDMIKDSGVEFLNGKDYDNDGHLFRRESFREAPHNSYLQFTAIPEVAGDIDYDMTAAYEPLPFLSKEEMNNLSGDEANYVELKSYSNKPEETISYVYDPEKEVYHRFTGNEQTVEFDTNEPVQLANVLIIEAPHEVIDDEGRRSVDLTTGGDAFLLQRGKVQRIGWMNENGMVIPVIEGSPAGFVPGKTWINVIPDTPGLEAVTAIE